MLADVAQMLLIMDLEFRQILHQYFMIFFVFKFVTHAAAIVKTFFTGVETIASGASLLGITAIFMEFLSVVHVGLPALTPLSRYAFHLFSAGSPPPVAISVQAAAALEPISTHLYIVGGALISSLGCILGKCGHVAN